MDGGPRIDRKIVKCSTYQADFMYEDAPEEHHLRRIFEFLEVNFCWLKARLEIIAIEVPLYVELGASIKA